MLYQNDCNVKNQESLICLLDFGKKGYLYEKKPSDCDKKYWV